MLCGYKGKYVPLNNISNAEITDYFRFYSPSLLSLSVRLFLAISAERSDTD